MCRYATQEIASGRSPGTDTKLSAGVVLPGRAAGEVARPRYLPVCQSDAVSTTPDPRWTN